MSRRVIALLVLVAAIVVAVGAYEAFGKDSNDSSSSSSNAAAWVSKFCTAVSGWKTDLQAAAKQATDNPTKQGVQDAVDSASSSTKETAATLRDLGLPPTERSEEAKNTLKQLQDQLRAGMDTIQKAIDGVSGLQGSIQAMSTVSTTLVTMRDQLKSGLTQLQNLPNGELKQAFDNSSECAPLRQEASS